MRRTYTYLMMVFWLTVPAVASAGKLHYSDNSWIAPDTVNVSGFEDNSLIHKVVEPWYDRFPTYTDLGNKERMNEAARDREKDADSSGKDSRSYSNILSPSFERIDGHSSVNGHSRGSNPWWETRSESDPMVRDLSRMDGGGFSSPGNGGGSVPSYHGR